MDKPFKIAYGTGEVEGNIARDQICFSNNKVSDICVDQLEFLSVNSATDIEKDQFSGIVGLSPGSQKSEVNGMPQLPSFIEQISKGVDKAGNRILDPIFSFFLTDDQSLTGKVILGGYDLAKFASKDLGEGDVMWCNTTPNQDYFWTIAMNSARLYGGTPINKDIIFQGIQLTATNLMIDTGLSYALAPRADIMSIVAALSNYGVKCENRSQKNEALNFLYCSINEMFYVTDLPSIQIKVLMK